MECKLLDLGLSYGDTVENAQDFFTVYEYETRGARAFSEQPYYFATEKDYLIHLRRLKADEPSIAILIGNSYFLETLAALPENIQEIHQIDIDPRVLGFTRFLLQSVYSASSYDDFKTTLKANKIELQIGKKKYSFSEDTIKNSILTSKESFDLCKKRLIQNKIILQGHVLNVSEHYSVDEFLQKIQFSSKKLAFLSLSNILEFLPFNDSILDMLQKFHMRATDDFTLLHSNYDKKEGRPISKREIRETMAFILKSFNRPPKPSPSHQTDFSFCFKFMLSAAVLGGAVMLIAGLIAAKSLLISAGAICLFLGGFSFFALRRKLFSCDNPQSKTIVNKHVHNTINQPVVRLPAASVF